MDSFEITATGWRQDVPDFRDFAPHSDSIDTWLSKLAEDQHAQKRDRVDLREYFPVVDNQRGINCATAHAAIGLLEYFHRRCYGNWTKLSRLFLYKTTRRLAGIPGNVSTDIRSTLKAIKTFGVPAEKHWPYVEGTFDDEPDAFLYSIAQSFETIRYVRLDTSLDPEISLASVKAFLTAGFPVVFGFSLPSSVTQDADIPYRPKFDDVRGGHAAIAVGYDDYRLRESKGALLIRNSWGKSWGEAGYGWLPYMFVKKSLATDFWTIIDPQWLELGEFTRPNLQS